MNFALLRSRFVHFLAFAGMTFCLSASLFAQDAPKSDDYKNDPDFEIGSLYNKSTDAINEEEWERAVFYIDRIIKEYAETAMEDMGPKFGVMYYRKGFCLSRMGEKRLDDAFEAYRICIEEWGNKPDTPAEKKNPVELNALVESAAIRQRQGDYAAAVALYEKAYAQIGQIQGVNKGAFLLQLGGCYVETGNIDKGVDIVGKTFENARGLGATPSALFEGFISLLKGWTKAGPGAREIEAIAFMQKHEDALALSAFDRDRYNFNPRLIKLAQQASESKMDSLSLKLFSMVASKSSVADELKANAADYATPPAKLVALIETTSKEAQNPESHDVIAQLALATAHQRVGNYRAAFTIYDNLITTFPKAKNLNHMIFGALQTASVIGDSDATVYFGNRIIKEFPDYAQKDAAASLVMQRLFFSGQYDEAMTLADQLRPGLPDGSLVRDLADFVTAAGKFYTRKYEESLPLLLEHSKKYPDSAYAENSLRLVGAGHVILQQWKKAEAPLDQFITKFPESASMDGALFDRAMVHFRQKEYTKTTEVVQRMRTEFAGSPMLDRALNLKGDVHFMQEENDKALDAYVGARATAARYTKEITDPHAVADQHAISQQLALASGDGDLEGALKLYDEFFPKYESSPYYAHTVAVGGWDALAAKGRTDEALNRIEKIMGQISNSDFTDGLEPLANSWLAKSIEIKKPAAEIRAKLLDWPLHGARKTPLLDATLLLLRMDLLEDEISADLPNREGELSVVSKELMAFDKKLLSSGTLYRLGNQLLAKDLENDSVSFYKEVIARDDSDYVPGAMVKLAKITMGEGGAAKLDEAIAQYEKIIVDYPGTKYAGEAIVEKARILYDNRKDMKAALPVLKDIKDNYKMLSQDDRAEMIFKCGRAAEETGDFDTAGPCYLQFFATLAGYVEYAPEARVRGMLLTWNHFSTLPGKNEAAEKKAAYDFMQKTAYGYRKRYAEGKDPGNWIGKAMWYYKDWQKKLNLPPDPEIEEGMVFPATLPQ